MNRCDFLTGTAAAALLPFAPNLGGAQVAETVSMIPLAPRTVWTVLPLPGGRAYRDFMAWYEPELERRRKANPMPRIAHDPPLTEFNDPFKHYRMRRQNHG